MHSIVVDIVFKILYVSTYLNLLKFAMHELA